MRVDFVQQHAEGTVQLQSSASKADTRLPNPEKAELLRPKVSKSTTTHSQNKVKTVTGRKKRKREISPPQPRENGKKVHFYQMPCSLLCD